MIRLEGGRGVTLIGTCSIPGCSGVSRARGFCNMHYARWWRTNNPMTIGPFGPPTGYIKEKPYKCAECGGERCKSKSGLCSSCYLKQYHRRTRTEVILRLGGKCECCGETRLEFLSIDHIKGKKYRSESSSSTYRIVRKLGYPKELFRVLCYNCNCSLGFNGYCPHKVESLCEVTYVR